MNNEIVEELKKMINENNYQVYNMIEEFPNKIIVKRNNTFNLNISEHEIYKEYISIYQLANKNGLHPVLIDHGDIGVFPTKEK